MKIYIVSYLDNECGKVEAFTNKAKANKRITELNEEEDIKQVFDLEENDFEISAKGLIEAVEAGALSVYK
jgi:hypothetical protein